MTGVQYNYFQRMDHVHYNYHHKQKLLLNTNKYGIWYIIINALFI